MRNSSALFLFLLLPLAIGGGGDAEFMFGHYLIAGETVDIGERWPELKEAKTIKEAQAQLRRFVEYGWFDRALLVAIERSDSVDEEERARLVRRVKDGVESRKMLRAIELMGNESRWRRRPISPISVVEKTIEVATGILWPFLSI